MDLNTAWFLLIGFLIAGYVVLDGFDLGVGVLHLFARNEGERRAHMAAIGPVWDGNEVWLVAGGGALFAAFPIVYATILSGFYLAFILLLVGLIFRAVSLEFRHGVDSDVWRRIWDFGFGLGSLVPSILFGVAAGNVLRGVPIGADGNYAGSFLGLLNPYAILIGLLSLALFLMHGALYLRVKTAGPLSDRMARWAMVAWILFVVLYAGATVTTRLVSPFLFDGIVVLPAFWALVAALLVGIAGIPIATRRARTGLAFLASSVVVVAMIGLAGLGLFPRLVPSLGGLERSLTVYNAASSPKTLGVMLVIAIIGMPVVIGYTIAVYRIFRGKVNEAGGAYHGS